MHNPENLRQSQLWALALSAVLAGQNRLRHDVVCGGDKTAQKIKMTKQALKRDWGMGSAANLRDSLQWLSSEGHSAGFAAERVYFSTLSDAGQDAYISSFPRESAEYVKYQILKIYHRKLPQAGILAWDLGRYVFLCRDAVLVGWITEQEAWKLIMPVARRAQQAYSGWNEYGMAYLAGRQFWLNQLSKENVDDHADYVRSLLLDSDSPWRQLNWNMDLA